MTVSLNCSGCNKPQYNPNFTGFNFNNNFVREIIIKDMPNDGSKSSTRLWKKFNNIFESQEKNPIEIRLYAASGDISAAFIDPEKGTSLANSIFQRRYNIFKNSVIDLMERAAKKADDLLKIQNNSERAKGLKIIGKIEE